MSLSYQQTHTFLPYQEPRGRESIHHRTKQTKNNTAYETIVEFNKKPPVSMLTVLVAKSLEGIEHVKNRNNNQDIGR